MWLPVLVLLLLGILFIALFESWATWYERQQRDMWHR